MNHPNGPIRPVPDPPFPPGSPCTTPPDDSDDVIVTRLTDHVTFHKPGDNDTTPCGQVQMADAIRPLPGLWRIKRDYFGTPCPDCYGLPTLALFRDLLNRALRPG